MYYITIHALGITHLTDDVRDVFAFIVRYGAGGVDIIHPE